MKEYPHLYFHFGWGKSGRYWGYEAWYQGLHFGTTSYSKVTKRQMQDEAADYVAAIKSHGH